MFGPCNLLEGECRDGIFQTKLGDFTTSGSQKKTQILIREADVEIEELERESDFRCIYSFFVGESYRVICEHNSGKRIIGLSKAPIKSPYVNVKFLKKEDVWSL